MKSQGRVAIHILTKTLSKMLIFIQLESNITSNLIAEISNQTSTQILIQARSKVMIREISTTIRTNRLLALFYRDPVTPQALVKCIRTLTQGR